MELAEARRRRLDELFVDQPFLSPTMKARSLHERLSQPLPLGLAGRIPLYLYDVERDEEFAGNEPSTLTIESIDETCEPISLEEARQQLQAYREPGQSDPLRKLRSSLLEPWIDGLKRVAQP